MSQSNGRSLLLQQNKHILFVDARNTGWSCVFSAQVAYGYRSHKETKQSINWRAMKAVHLALQTSSGLKNTSILVRTDNVTTTNILQRASYFFAGFPSIPLHKAYPCAFYFIIGTALIKLYNKVA
ncbi:hypothetical protein PHYBLDRAFT_73800 [Phycomyces blakesleeanus NRRL 1555(-)]|uniref:RNase H type-1 domain-containing protein n=1 Tax=Phycomyces blakesleeanus (strain ATCC 8743b / DSM 1359 / FGSC 10004 / NBRC 33097 / NRRL 1555) TaxID=763407 RepID=A0A162Z907_PHYB8|nr:hypothetical protein PHYBLDRAFT_73800 [Phycomyces blakesleeanus NRRL 1555(-)]OAD65111.1 hypothetical protein PHYBLDRAFT_73800 [Phycomyces blakesleeanus NRRL 1555(-)]|eukprot:XP_018283151.1 hypothetical protein PHYBLDRAFT_73800 [Phycomyces blakesleeanus NRRL 1555(-)]